MGSGRDGRPYFFLSYARTPRHDPADREDPDRWVHKLYKDLCEEILQMTDALPEEAGFMDRENRLGVEWSSGLIAALTRCRVFVPLYSKRYFESSNCGREWFAFARRELNHRAQGHAAASAIVPALWTRLERDRIPEVAQSLQYEHSDLGERYCAEGFYGIMKLQNYRADYKRAVHRLAERIVAVADENFPYAEHGTARETERIGFESLHSAFGPESARRTTYGQLEIAVLAHDKTTVPEGRLGEYYGETPRNWSPYLPDYPQPVVEYALELASKCLDCEAMVGAIQDDPTDQAGNGCPVPPSLWLVDAWVGMSESYRRRLERLDQIEESWVSVLVPWNIQDPGLREAEHELRQNLQRHLGRKLASVPRRCQMAATGIPTLQEFGQLMPEMTMTMLKRFRRDAPAHPPEGPVLERPRLRRTGPESSGESR
jgi:FxsC-like protein